MENLPLVTVNILSFNRKDDLRNTLQKVYEQDYKNIEVIAVDNASTDGTCEMVQAEFPNVILIQLEKNIGIAGWNKGFEIAKGEYVLVLDDDSFPETETIIKSLQYFSDDPKLDMLACQIKNTVLNLYETYGFNEVPYFFVGCGAFIKKEVIKTIGSFNTQIFIYLHELDFCIRAYDQGFTLKYFGDCTIIHHQSHLSRGTVVFNPFQSKYRYENYFISYTIILFQYFSVLSIIKYFPKWLINRLIVAIKFNFFSSYVKLIIEIISRFSKIISNRKPISYTTQTFYNYGNMPLLDRHFFPNKP